MGDVLRSKKRVPQFLNSAYYQVRVWPRNLPFEWVKDLLERRPPTQNCWVRLVMQSPAVKWKLNRGSSLMTG